jgi:hypothetical protein
MEPLLCPDLLDALQFEFDTQNTLSLIETSPEAVSQLPGPPRRVLRHASLSESGLRAWLQYEDVDAKNVCKDGFRLLVCERSLQDPITICLSETNFANVLKCFNLAPETKASILQFLGACGKHVVFTKANNQKCLQIIIKAYQKGEIGNFTLSLCHNFETAWTDALVCWTEWPWSRRMHTREKLYESRMAHVLALLNSWRDLWAHPTCLPLVFLSSYCRRVEERCNTLSDSLVELDCQLGVNRSGRMYSERDMKTWPTDLDFKTLTVDLHSASNRVTFVHQACQWAIRCAGFLRDLESEIEKEHILGSTCSRRVTEFLQYRTSVMRGVEVAFEGLKARTQAATNVVRSFPTTAGNGY